MEMIEREAKRQRQLNAAKVTVRNPVPRREAKVLYAAERKRRIRLLKAHGRNALKVSA